MLLAEAFPSFHFEGDHFVTLNKIADDLCFHHSFHCAACSNFTSVVGEQHFFEFNLISGFTLQVRNIQALTFLYLELLTCDFYNC